MVVQPLESSGRRRANGDWHLRNTPLLEMTRRRVGEQARQAMTSAVSHGLKLWQQIAIALAAATLLILLVDRREPVVIDSISVVPEKVVAGEDAQIVIKMDVKRGCWGEITRTLVSERPGSPVQVYDRAALTFQSGKSEVTRTLHVPTGFSHGPAIYRSEVDFVCNPLQNIWPIKVQAPDAPMMIEASGSKS